MNNVEQTVNNVMGILGMFFSTQPWFTILKNIVAIAITTVEAASATGSIEKQNKKTEAIKQIDQSCEKLGIYKMINKNLVMTFVGPVIDAIIWALNTFAPGWDKELTAANAENK